MSWSYSGNPAASPRDAARFYVQDTVEADPQFSDEEIDFALTQFATPIATAQSLCYQLVAKYARKADKVVGDLKLSYSQIAKNYADLIAKLNAQVASASQLTVFSGGTSVSDVQAAASNTATVQPIFSIGMQDISGTPTTTQTTTDNQFSTP